jgi:gliding motility-associated-like protein
VVTDAAGCRDTIPAVLITQPALLTASATAVDVSCFGRQDGSVTVAAAGGAVPYRYSWDGLPGQTGNFTGELGAGGYRIFVADANGCQTTATTLVREPERLILLPVSVTDAFCELPNGAISVSAQGGTPAYQYLWRQLPGFNQPSSNQLTSGTYQIVLTDARGCQDSLRLVVEDIPAPIAQFAADPDLGVPVVRARAIFQMINQSRNAIAYEWDFGDGSPVSFEANPQHKFHTPGEYTIRLRAWNETLACPDDTTLTVIVLADGDLWAPTGFSPNGDQVNDLFGLQGSGIESLELILFNRWGEEIIRFTQVTDTWDGRLPGGAEAPEGVYTYVLKARLNTGRVIERGQTLTLFR